MKKMTYNKFNTIEVPTLILSSVAHKHYGVINNVDVSTISANFNMNSAQELSFEVKKIVNGVKCDLWDKIVSLKYVYVPEHHEYYKMDVTVEDGVDTTKKCVLTSASEYELSNKIIQSLEVNSDVDYAYQEYYTNTTAYKRTIFYNPTDEDSSLLNRILKDKAPDWTIKYVAPTLAKIQRTFSISKQSIYDVLVNTVGKEIECLFVFDSVDRTISAYDLLNTCTNCQPNYRGNFTDVCPKCGRSDSIVKGYGKETGIYISYENYSDRMTIDGDEASVKNCFFVSGGDDRMTNTIKLYNPTMTNYIYNFSAMDYDDMPIELSNKIHDYELLYNTKKAQYEPILKSYYEAVNQYYYYKTSMMPRNASRWISGNYYDLTDHVYVMTLPLIYHLECIQNGYSGSTEFDATHTYDGEIIQDNQVKWKVCTNTVSPGTAAQQIPQIEQYLHDNTVWFTDSRMPDIAIVTTAVKNIASLGSTAYFRVSKDETVTPTISGNTWTGNLIITNLNDSEDVITHQFTATIKLCVAKDDYAEYLINKVKTRMENDEAAFTTIFKITNDTQFQNALTEYSLDRLTSFEESYEGTISILQQQGVGDPDGEFHGFKNHVPTTDPSYPGMYDAIYLPYWNRLNWIKAEIGRRSPIVAQYKKLMEDTEKQMGNIAQSLDMETFFGDELWKMFWGYIRESDYQNSNYICGNQADGAILEDAGTLLGLAQEELKKACELQYTLSDTLKNLLNTDGFKNFRDGFEIGDYLICRVDNELFKLRLIQVQYKYDSPDELSVTFSNVSKIENYFSDVQSVLNQATSIALSYQNTVNQVDKNNYTTANVNEWIEQGLNTALTKLKNNNAEEVTYDNRGFMAKVYDDVTGRYGDQQVRMTHDMIAFTKDNWKTASLALGELSYPYYTSNTDTWGDAMGYGMISEFVNAGNIIGSTIVGGEIYSRNYKKNTNPTGSYINLSDGTFELGGGRLTWNNSQLHVTGDITATSGTFTGTIHAQNGTIGDWTIGANYLETSENGVYGGAGLQYGNVSYDASNLSKDKLWVGNRRGINGTSYDITTFIGDYRFRTSGQDDNHSGVFVSTGADTYYVALTETGNIYSSGSISCGGYTISGLAAGTIYGTNLTITGTKNRVIETESYGNRLQYCYETPTPLFGDIGEGTIDDTGVCMIYIDDIFAETANTNCDYQVFLQSYSEYNCYVSERTPFYFVVNGEPNTSFGWEIKAVQKDFETYRLDTFGADDEMETDNSINEVWNYLDDLLYDVDKEDI